MGAKKMERRRFPRVSLNLLVQYRFDTLDDFLIEHAADISEGGMFIRCDDAKSEGALVYLQFNLKDGTKLIEGLGKVVRVNPKRSPDPGMGIEFVNFDPESRELIRAILRRKSEVAKGHGDELPTVDIDIERH